jgi:hypothetical protein
MPSLEQYLEQADKLAQEVVNAWGINVQAGNTPLLTAQVKVLLDNACRYREARTLADNHRQFNVLGKQAEAQEKTTRQAFAEAYKVFDEEHVGKP